MDVIIRSLELEDAFTSFRWRNDSEVFKYTANKYDHKITLAEELSWIKRVIKKKDDYRCAIIADGEYVGNIYLTDISNRGAFYHVFIGNKEYWGKGIAKKASLLLLDYGFKELGLNIVSLHVREDNTPALRLYYGIGFRQIYSEGNWKTMAITPDDFYQQNSLAI